MEIDRVIEVVADSLCTDTTGITATTNIADDLNADSLDAVEIQMDLEDEFDVQIPDEDMEKLKTIQDIVNYLTGLGK